MICTAGVSKSLPPSDSCSNARSIALRYPGAISSSASRKHSHSPDAVFPISLRTDAIVPSGS